MILGLPFPTYLGWFVGPALTVLMLKPQALDLVASDGKHVVPSLWSPQISHWKTRRLTGRLSLIHI